MARSRNIKPGFFKNEVLAKLKPHDRLLFIGLWTLADREGRMEDRPERIRAEVFPYEQIRANEMLASLSSAGFICRYVANGSNYIQIANFCKHQNPHYKEVPSEIPPPPGHRDSLYIVGGVPGSVRQEVMARDGLSCVQCGSKSELSVDHIIPRSAGGSNDPKNLQTLCMKCNSSKNNRTDSTLGQRQVNVDSPSAYDPETSRADSLLLIPDSPIPDTIRPATPEFPAVDRFESLWKKYPNKDGKRDALRHFKATVKCEEDWDNIQKAFSNYLASERVKKGFIKNGSTWFNGWRDWVEYTEGAPGDRAASEESKRRAQRWGIE